MKAKYYPYFIVGVIIAFIGVCIYTVYLSFGYPVDEDESYFRKYQDVENNFAQIKQIEQDFLNNFDILILAPKIKINFNKLEAFSVNDELVLKIIEKSNLKAKDLNVIAKLTRPHTKKDDQKINAIYNDDLKEFKIDLSTLKNGRWTLLINYEINNLNKFYKLELCKNICDKN